MKIIGLNSDQLSTVREIKWFLHDIATIAAKMSAVYAINPWLNDSIDIANVIPMSVDEWYNELMAKCEEIDKELYKTYPTWE